MHNASLLEITRQAGQRNRGAVHYHFGSREGMLVAVLACREAEFLGPRERELLAIAESRPDDDLASAFEAVVRPSVELAETGLRGRCFLQIVAQLKVDDEPESFDPAVQEVLSRSGGRSLRADQRAAAGDVRGAPGLERDRTRDQLPAALDRRPRQGTGPGGVPGRPQLPTDDFSAT